MEWPGTRRKSRSRNSTAGCKRHGKAAPPAPLSRTDLDLICLLQRFPFGTFVTRVHTDDNALSTRLREWMRALRRLSTATAAHRCVRFVELSTIEQILAGYEHPSVAHGLCPPLLPNTELPQLLPPSTVDRSRPSDPAASVRAI